MERNERGQWVAAKTEHEAEGNDEATVTLPGTPQMLEALAGQLVCAPEDVTLGQILRVLDETAARATTLQRELEKRHAERMYAAMHPPKAVMTDEDAAVLILSKCQPDAIQQFQLARETAPAGMSDANIIAALLTMLCNTSEQHTGDFEGINTAPVQLAVGSSRGAALPPSVDETRLRGLGLEPHPCECCGAVFTPTKQKQRFGCEACGAYVTSYLVGIDYDNRVYQANRTPQGFATYCLHQRVQCTCAGAVPVGPLDDASLRGVAVPAGAIPTQMLTMAERLPAVGAVDIFAPVPGR